VTKGGEGTWWPYSHDGEGRSWEESLSSKIERKVREGHECSWKGQALAGITLQHTTVIITMI
jgi:hypothetical protein